MSRVIHYSPLSTSFYCHPAGTCSLFYEHIQIWVRAISNRNCLIFSLRLCASSAKKNNNNNTTIWKVPNMSESLQGRLLHWYILSLPETSTRQCGITWTTLALFRWRHFSLRISGLCDVAFIYFAFSTCASLVFCFCVIETVSVAHKLLLTYFCQWQRVMVSLCCLVCLFDCLS